MSFFSVIIPLYNKENYIKKTLHSVLNQDFDNFEIIIVNDCSTDNSLSIVTNYKDSRIKIINNQKNLGLSATRNVGILNADSEYITFIDADDLWKSFYLSEIFKLIKMFPQASIFGTNYEEISAQGDTISTLIDKSLQLEKRKLIPNFFSLNIAQPMYCYSTVAFHKNVFKNSGNFDEKITFAEDIDFNVRANLNNLLAYSSKVCASYNLLSENQITTSSISNKILPDLDKYQSLCTKENGLEKYLDFNRYVFAMHYKTEKEHIRFNEIKGKINYKNLTTKQVLLLKSPLFIVFIIRKLKSFLIKFNIKISSY